MILHIITIEKLVPEHKFNKTTELNSILKAFWVWRIFMYTFQSRVRYSEINQERTLSLSSILDYFQDCSNFHSEDLGVGISYLESRKRVWLLSSWQIEILEPITIGTWPYDFRGLYGYRNFILYNEKHGRKVSAYANSIWFLLDTSTGLPTRITPEDMRAYPLEPAYPMEYAPRKITLPDASLLQSASFPPIPVSPALLDTNHHVNNGQYVRIAESFLPEGFSIHGMRAEYRRAAVLNDFIYPVLLRQKQADHCCYILLADTAGQPYAIINFY